MVIDINSIGSVPPGKPESKSQNNAPQQSATQNAPASGSTVEQDSVALSSTAQELGRLKEALASQPEVDEQRVEQLREQIASGSYSVDASDVAGRIIENDQNFLL